MPDEAGAERTGRTAIGRAWGWALSKIPSITAVFDKFEKTIDFIRKVSISIAALVGVCLAVVLIWRSAFDGTVAVEPVIVQFSGGTYSNAELATMALVKQVDAIQRAGLSEWHKLYVGEAKAPVDLQVPGSPFTLHAGMREIARLMGRKPLSIKASIVTANGKPLGAVGIEGLPAAQATCSERDGYTTDAEVIDCLALTAIAFLDPKTAAAYVFRDEEAKCLAADGEPAAGSPLEREERRLVKRREGCEFKTTQALIAKALQRGYADDLPWVPYIYGKVHLVRATAAAQSQDRQEQIGELDQAYFRFRDSQKQKPGSVSAVAAMFGALATKGIAFHEWAGGAGWDDDPASPMRWHLRLAGLTFDDALKQLKDIPGTRPPRLDALVHHLEGLVYYRQWMLMAHLRTKSAAITMASGEEELKHLRRAIDSFERAAADERTDGLYMDWGNALRAAKRFGDAADKYVQAADIRPQAYGPRLNYTIALLDGVIQGPQPEIGRAHV